LVKLSPKVNCHVYASTFYVVSNVTRRAVPAPPVNSRQRHLVLTDAAAMSPTVR